MTSRKLYFGLFGFLNLILFSYLIFLRTPNAGDTQLLVKFHHQEHELSCEAAALKIVLDYYGDSVSETEILGRMPVDDTPHINGTWGDPSQGFVGSVDGLMGKTGYGIYWQALSKLASQWRHSEVIEGGALTDLTAHIVQKHPVIVWGYKDSRQSIRWKTKSGQPVMALEGEHTRVVYGFRGKPESPEGIYLMDPTSGPLYWSSQYFLENWNSFGRVGVVLFP